MKSWRNVGCTALLGILFYQFSKDIQTDKEIPTVEEFVRSHDYPIEAHEVISEDGYIVTLFRIKLGQGDGRSRRPAIMLHHGAIGSSYNFVGLGPNASLAFLLADRGYDVWLVNARGSEYSLKHVSENISYNDFWNFTFHEMGIYDLPAQIDYVLNHTGQAKLTYIGHSMGGTTIAVLLSLKPEYNNKIELYIGLAPAINVQEVTSSIMIIIGTIIGPIYIKYFGYGNWLPWTQNMIELQKRSCQPESFFRFTCLNTYYDVGESTQIIEERLPEIFASVISSGSIKAAHHFGQIHLSGKFRQYDYGTEENLKTYGSEEPPEYDLSKIKVPSVFYFSDSDKAVYAEGVAQLAKTLPNATAKRVPISKFNHLDFLYGRDVVDVVYKDIFKVLNEKKIQQEEKHCPLSSAENNK